MKKRGATINIWNLKENGNKFVFCVLFMLFGLLSLNNFDCQVVFVQKDVKTSFWTHPSWSSDQSLGTILFKILWGRIQKSEVKTALFSARAGRLNTFAVKREVQKHIEANQVFLWDVIQITTLGYWFCLISIFGLVCCLAKHFFSFRIWFNGFLSSFQGWIWINPF